MGADKLVLDTVTLDGLGIAPAAEPKRAAIVLSNLWTPFLKRIERPVFSVVCQKIRRPRCDLHVKLNTVLLTLNWYFPVTLVADMVLSQPAQASTASYFAKLNHNSRIQ